MTLLPKSRVIKVEMYVVLPITASMDEVHEWIQLEVGQIGGMSINNPLSNFSPEAATGVTLTDTGKFMHERILEKNKDGSFKIERTFQDVPYWGKPVIDEILKEKK